MNTIKPQNYYKRSNQKNAKCLSAFFVVTSQRLLRFFAFLRLHLYGIKSKFLKIPKRYRRHIYAILVLLIIALLQSTLFNSFRILNVKPDAILATLIIFVPFFSLRWSVIFAFLGGIFRDIFSILPFGFNVIICILWVILAKQISRRLSLENIFTRGAMLCLIILLNNFAIWFFLFVLDRPIVIGNFLKIISLESISTLVLSLPMYILFTHLFMDKQ